ncbi:hypothetical protein [Ralstonia pseudosolanacearum]
MSKFTKFLTTIGINIGTGATVGATFLGPLAILNSESLGGYMNPNIIDGWHYNPASDGWYRRSILDGQVDPDSLASAEKSSELNNQRYWRELYNRIEGVSAANDAAGSIAPPDIFEIIKNIPEIYNRYREVFPKILRDLRNYLGIGDNVSTNFRSAQTVQIYRDPIILDLDDDGL